MAKQKLQCPYCSTTSSRGTGLASHIRGSHPAEYSDWSMRRKGLQQKAAAPVSGRASASSGLKDIVATLERQSAAIDQALSALRQLDGVATESVSAEAVAPRPARRKRKGGGMTPEGRARLIAALKKRWAAKKAGN